MKKATLSVSKGTGRRGLYKTCGLEADFVDAARIVGEQVVA
jgi:hypothetical protein